MKPKLTCPDCGSKKVKTTIVTRTTHSGPITWAIHNCKECGYRWREVQPVSGAKAAAVKVVCPECLSDKVRVKRVTVTDRFTGETTDMLVCRCRNCDYHWRQVA